MEFKSQIELFKQLKESAGSHSPSMSTLMKSFENFSIKIDACFLSNPYATELFFSKFSEDVIRTNDIVKFLEYYPSQNDVIAKELSKALNIESDKILIGNGAIEIIQSLVNDEGVKKVMSILPTFSSYYEFVRVDTEVVYYYLNPEENFRLDVDDLIESVKINKPDTLILINPNNPDGSYIEQSEIERILINCMELKQVIVDESFIHFAYENESLDLVSSIGFLDRYPNLVIVKSMSKDFGIAGVRAGYGLMNAKRVLEFLSKGFLWNSNGLAEYFFNIYSTEEFRNQYELVRKKYIVETKKFIGTLSEIAEIKVFPSKGNFVLIQLPVSIDVDYFVGFFLFKYGIYMRTCSDKRSLENGGFIRLAARSIEENEYVLNCLNDFFNNHEILD